MWHKYDCLTNLNYGHSPLGFGHRKKKRKKKKNTRTHMNPSQSVLPEAHRVDHSLCGLQTLIFKPIHCGAGCGKHLNPAQFGPHTPLLAGRHVYRGHTRGKQFATCKWPRVGGVVDSVVANCTICHVYNKYTWPLCHVAHKTRGRQFDSLPCVLWTTWPLCHVYMSTRGRLSAMCILHVSDCLPRVLINTWHIGHVFHSTHV